jgi:drug/metabolite transporter (DMT)-like permease
MTAVPEHRSALVPRLQMLAAAALFSTGGSVIKATTMTSWQIAAFRSGVAALALLILSRAAWRGWTWRTPLVGACYSVTLALFVQANKLTTAANAIFLQATAPLYLVLLAPLLLKEPIRRRDLLMLLVIGIGMGLFLVGRETASVTAPDPRLGNLLAAASGISWALTIIGLRWLARSTPPGSGGAGGAAVPATVAGNAIGFIACIGFAFPVTDVSTSDVLWVLFLGVFQIAGAYLFLTASMERVPAFEAGLLLLLEPVLSAVWAWAAHGEFPGPFSLAGAALILTATVAHAAYSARASAADPDATQVPHTAIERAPDPGLDN